MAADAELDHAHGRARPSSSCAGARSRRSSWSTRPRRGSRRPTAPSTRCPRCASIALATTPAGSSRGSGRDQPSAGPGSAACRSRSRTSTTSPASARPTARPSTPITCPSAPTSWSSGWRSAARSSSASRTRRSSAPAANTFNEVFGETRNPWNTALTPAGSSGGSAAALAAGQVWLATGSDLGGSLRTPASFCSVVGLRPSPGRVAHGPREQPFDTLVGGGAHGTDRRRRRADARRHGRRPPGGPARRSTRPLESFGRRRGEADSRRGGSPSRPISGSSPVDPEVARDLRVGRAPVRGAGRRRRRRLPRPRRRARGRSRSSAPSASSPISSRSTRRAATS